MLVIVLSWKISLTPSPLSPPVPRLHAGHIAGDRKSNTPLSNLYVTMLRQLGFEADKFGASTGEVSELGITA